MKSKKCAEKDKRIKELEAKATCKHCGGMEHNSKEHEQSSEIHDLHNELTDLKARIANIRRINDDAAEGCAGYDECPHCQINKALRGEKK